ncbi:unnamed protein product, partial [Oppiella nova]
MNSLYYVCLAMCALIPVIICDTNVEKCSEKCEPQKCQPPEDCLAGVIKDGERCFNETLRKKLPRSYEIYADCGENLVCKMRTDMEANDPPEA